MKTIPITDFGKDHFSLLGYIETLCVDSIEEGVGTIDRERMRCNEKRHPQFVGRRCADVVRWKPEYGTRLSGYFLDGDKRDPKRQIGDHDDWDALEDLEEAGLVTWISSVNGFVTLTEFGIRVANALRAHKAKGGQFATFEWKEGARGVRTR